MGFLKSFGRFCLLITFSLSPIYADNAPPTNPEKSETPKEETITTSHSVTIDGVKIPYKATVGTQLLLNDKGNPKASIFYIAYTKDDVKDLRRRPVTFCFNGGPGSSSVWLHLGMLGPKRVDINEEGTEARQPFHLLENPYSLLDLTDLVFIDPVSTGYSRAAEDPKSFHGLDADIQSMAEFIRIYTTRNLRWESPKFLAGESYGTTRAAGLTMELSDTYHMETDGIILVSTVLNFQTIKESSGNDLPYILFLPTMTRTALYHKKLSPELQADEKKTIEEVTQFAFGEYAMALFKGNKIDDKEKKAIEEKLARYTGISKEYVELTNLRINQLRFCKELLRKEHRTVGRFDSRLKGIDSDLCGNIFEFDPGFENVFGPFTATFNEYVRAELNWKKDDEYKILADVQPWNYGPNASNEYLNIGEKLRAAMSRDTRMQVFVAAGYFDMAIPYMASDYTFSHLGLDPSLISNVTIKNYYGGHMMFLYHPTIVEMKKDLTQFFRQRLSKQTAVN